MTVMMSYISSSALWLCLTLVVASRSGKAFTVTADQLTVSRRATFFRGGAAAQKSPVLSRAIEEEKGSTTSRTTTATMELSSSSSAADDDESRNEITLGDVDKQNRGPLKVLFLSADTGGGHRASAESLAAQFLKHFPGSTYDLLDVWTTDGCLPWSTLVDSYTHLSARPKQWKALYHISNFWLNEKVTDWHSNWTCGKRIQKRIASYDPDVVVCVHPAMSGSPSYQLAKINKKLGKHVPFYIVVTDLGTAHATWFRSKRCDKIYVASERIKKLAKRRGRFPDDRIVMAGLPIRQSFADEAEKLNDRTTEAGKTYQAKIRENLDIDTDRQMVLVMGGGEGVGGLEKIVDELYTAFMKEGVKASIYVVCGRNEKLKANLATKDWGKVLAGEHKPKKRNVLARLNNRRGKKMEPGVTTVTNGISSSGANNDDGQGDVKVVGLGFVTQMAEYMVAADILVSKAGPGTIAEAACVGLPVMMTSFLPGQEAGNVDVVLENGFGAYNDDPVEIAQEVTSWIKNPRVLDDMSRQAKSVGRPHAAEEIVLDIGTGANAWKSLSLDAKRMTELQW